VRDMSRPRLASVGRPHGFSPSDHCSDPVQHLGRAKEASEFVKHGSAEATIEIELAADPRRHRKNPVIRCKIERDGNKSHFSINGTRSNGKNVRKLAQSYSIQIDNLCQFLPQDRVVEFAAMTPVELLHSTQRAVASREMIEWHEGLKELRKEQRQILNANAQDRETLANLEGRHRMQEADVQRVREREQVKEQVRRLEALRPFAVFRECKERHKRTKERSRAAAAELEKLEDELEPSLRAINSKERYRDAVKHVVDERKDTVVATARRKADKCAEKVARLQENMDDLAKEKDNEKRGRGANKREVARLEGIIRDLDLKLQGEPPQFDPHAFNEQLVSFKYFGKKIGAPS
jgi:structural maintenance of chromosomes protein 5